VCKERKGWGHIRYGYHEDEDGLLRPCPPEQAVLCLIHWLSNKDLTYPAIANELNARGYRTRIGTQYKWSKVAKILHKHKPHYEYWEAFKASRK
jgi:hypothetical protein